MNAVSEEAVTSATGKTWQEWFLLIDRHDGINLTHKEIVRVLKENSDLSSWWQQSVTVEYEIARGKRKPHEMLDGFQISKNKTIQAPVGKLFAAWVEMEERMKWLEQPNFTIRKATPDKSLRITWVDGGSHLDVHFYPKEGRTQISINHKKLSSAKDAEAMKAFWEAQLRHLDALHTRK